MAKSTKTKGTTKAKGAKKRSVRALPPALRKNAEAMAANARKALKKRAKQALVDAKAAYAESLRGLWEFGVALTVLADLTVAVEVGMILAALLYIRKVTTTTTVARVTPEYVKSGFAHSLQTN